MARKFPHKDFRGSYNRLTEMALRMAILMASLENNNKITIKHWARAQELAELLRKNLHRLYDQVNGGEAKNSLELEIMKVIKEHFDRKQFTARNLQDANSKLKKEQIGTVNKILKDLQVGGRLTSTPPPEGQETSKSPWYRR
ncbi:hypothetical protein KDI_53510 [Dictyobacter arantiisoli]|uniref:Uncharacterized protein n=2 Tax=Dictyobacter arantiisoli TaxID=2014874 RepID=A0A5A5TK19_9CHLR|nr:hypothetical protein [Dictyobacter arantiisoli]GCF11787.1 hypothetical protein KDI_53510 [Dictyobacter arantiisoli]